MLMDFYGWTVRAATECASEASRLSDGRHLSWHAHSRSWRGPRDRRKRLPGDAPESGDEIEVPVSAQQRKRVLAAKRSDPQVIGRDGLAFGS